MMQVDSVDPFAAGEWLDPSDPPASLREPLRVTGRAAAPYVADTVRALREPLAVAEIGLPLARAVGGHQTYVCGLAAMRVATPHTLFMVQRVQDLHGTLGADARATVTSLVAGTGWDELIAERTPARVALERHRLVRSA